MQAKIIGRTRGRRPSKPPESPRVRAERAAFAKLSRTPKDRRSSVTFAAAAGDYISERPGLKYSTLCSYRYIFQNYLLSEFGDSPVADISEQKVARFQARLAKRLSPTRTNNIMNLLRFVMNVCERRHLIKQDPTPNVAKLTIAPPSIDPFTKQEVDLVISNVEPHYQPLFVCLAWTGARPNELGALRWRDVDFRRNEIRISKGRYRGVEELPKTTASSRVIPMFSVVREALMQLRDSNDCNSEEHVFKTKRGLPLNKTMSEIWRLAVLKSKLRHRPSYQLRHTFASICLESGVTPGWISSMLGHATPATTFRHYARFFGSRENEERIEALLQARTSQ